jgi:hypothetical protein
MLDFSALAKDTSAMNSRCFYASCVVAIEASLLFGFGCGGDEVLPGSMDPSMDPALTSGRPPVLRKPDNAVGGFFMEIPEMTLLPGEEKEPCYLFPLEIAGPSRLVNAAVVTTQAGLHHGNITTRHKSGDGVRTCKSGTQEDLAIEIANGGTVLFASSTQVRGTEWQRFAEGMAFRVPDDQEIVARMHYINATDKPIKISPRYEWFTVAESDLKQRLAPFAWTYMKFHIPPKSSLTVFGDCPLPRPMHLVQTLPHMHGLGRRFTLSLSGGPRHGELILDNDSYGARGETDIRLYDPAIDLTQGGLGNGARFSCTWENTFDKVIEYGVGDNEMCILFGYAYPPENTFSAAAQEDVDCITISAPNP